MREIDVATAQFEHRDNDKQYNLSRIAALARQAVEQGAEIVSFHEGCIPGYSWIQPLDKPELLSVAEPVPDGPSVRRLCDIARQLKTVIMAGLFERDANDHVYNCYVTVGPGGFITSFRKLHPFVNPHLSAGNGYNVIDLLGCRVGFLICYDNNLPENVRMTAMHGAEIIFMPHVTGCLPSAMPGRGTVDRSLWDHRQHDPVSLRQEFQGPKGRGWLMRWLPARAHDNGLFLVFSNGVGPDDNEVRTGNAMILDPYGRIIAETSSIEDDLVIADLDPKLRERCTGVRWIRARRPELYHSLTERTGREQDTRAVRFDHKSDPAT
jgi:predicted amidohydrolase